MMTAPNLDNAHTLGTLLHGMAELSPAAGNTLITGLTLDSRKVVPGELFLAVAGSREHGAEYIDQAIERGAVAVAYEAGAPLVGEWPVPLVAVEGLGEKSSEIAGRFYGHPSHEMLVIGVTGTNGKTSVSQFIGQTLGSEYLCGLIGTLGSGFYGKLRDTGHTTPDAVTLQAELAAMRDVGARYAVLEVSSHGLDQGRVNGIQFDVAVFTNLSHEHLDYHGDMEAYAEAKQRLFQRPGLRHAVINLDDAVGRRWFAELPAGVEGIGYGLEDDFDGLDGTLIRGHDLVLDSAGLRLQLVTPWGEGVLATGLLGRFNASNLLAALGALRAAKVPFGEALPRLARVRTVPGRMERFGAEGQPTVVVDYAHTPDALEQALLALREHCRGQLWCVFGCGGDRDRAKRPLMGAVAERLAEHVVLTDDNPRSEDPFRIIEEIQAGMRNPDAGYVQRDRRAAIGHALSLARPGDMVLVAGKGHEETQQVGSERLVFSDRQVVAQLLGERRDG